MEYTSFEAMKARDNVVPKHEPKEDEKDLMINMDVIQKDGGFFRKGNNYKQAFFPFDCLNYTYTFLFKFGIPKL